MHMESNLSVRARCVLDAEEMQTIKGLAGTRRGKDRTCADPNLIN